MQLVKHHGLGNDFLVVFRDGSWAGRPGHELAALAARACDRRTGVGADGLLIGEDDPEASARMVLFNADGGRAEMSGNGIRCFAHALATRRGDHSRLTINTDVGLRTVDLIPTEDPATWLATVDMGEVTEIAEPTGWGELGADPGRPVAHLSLGNPHAVVPVDDVSAVDLAALGSQDPTRQSGDHRGRSGAQRDHDAGPRAWRRDHRGVRDRSLRGGGRGVAMGSGRVGRREIDRPHGWGKCKRWVRRQPLTPTPRRG